MKTKFTKKQLWMQNFETEFLKLKPELHGKCDWNAANYLFSIGIDAKDAAYQKANDYRN